MAGAGSAGIGVASMLLQGMVEQGMNRDRARKNFWVLDKDGLLGTARKDVRESGRQAHPMASSSSSSPCILPPSPACLRATSTVFDC